MTETKPLLLPIPRNLKMDKGAFTLPSEALILMDSPQLLFEAQTAQAALMQFAKCQWGIAAGTDIPNSLLSLIIDASVPLQEGYWLTIDASGITIAGADTAGVFYGVCTLRQLLQQYGSSLPYLTINDWPDFPARGVMLDISRDKVPTLQTVLDLVERLASWKINQLQLYFEHTFAYRKHPEVWAQASPFTGEEILELDAFCRQRHIELVPNQNSLGHMERWLKHERYYHLAESPEGFEPPWGGGHRPASTLNPLDPGSIELVTSLYDELLPHFTSPHFNVGGDEPWELGKGKSKAEFEARGGRVYLDYLLKLYEAVKARGRQMQFWADIIIHYPDLIPEIPKDITAMPWAYEGGEAAEKEWERQCEIISGAGLPFYVCPGTSSWNGLTGRSDNAVDNCAITARVGLKYGASGYLVTDWGDNGHWQALPISYTGFAYGAGVAWCYEANQALDMPAVLSTFAFDDSANVMGKLAFDLGNIYHITSPEHINGQALAYALQIPAKNFEQSRNMAESTGANLSAKALHETITRIDAIMNSLENNAMSRADGELICGEFRQAADLLRHSARRTLHLNGESGDTPQTLLADLQDLIARQRDLWLARNRRGGLDDSIQRFDMLINEYRAIMS